MEMSVLERQRAMFHRLYHQNDHQQLLSHCCPPPQKPTTSSSPLSNSNNSSIMPKPHHQCNSTKKRKAEFDFEEGKKRGAKGEEAGEEQSVITSKTDRETSTNTCSKESSKLSEVHKPDYIHVRARRGQATDSHSIAERARREKISKKMKCLQDLVPGCNKVTGKAGMLDEIINYVQSLQKQVEFLSMKLAALNPRLDCCIDHFFAKDIPAYVANLPAAAQLQATNSTCFQYNQMEQGTSGCGPDTAIDQSQMIAQKAGFSSVPISDEFLDSPSIPQLPQLPGWDSEWSSLFNITFH